MRLLRALLPTVVWTSPSLAAGGPGQVPASPAALYQQACAACHGSEGRGLLPGHPLLDTFDVEPPDFTDPLFNSREPAADWELVIKYGGVTMGLSETMPAYGDFLDDEQIADLVGYMKTMADTSAYPPGEMNLVRPVETIKAYPEDELILLGRYDRNDPGEPNGLKTTLYYASRLGSRGQLEVKAVHEAEGDRNQLDEVEVGFKLAAAHSLEKQTLLSVGLEAAVPVIDRDRPTFVVPYVSVAKVLNEAFTLQGTVRTEQSTDGGADSRLRSSAVLHWLPSPFPRAFFPGLEAKLVVPYGSDLDTQFSLIPQVLVGLNRGGSVAIAVGLELPVTGIDRDYSLHWFLLWDLADGAFWKGW